MRRALVLLAAAAAFAVVFVASASADYGPNAVRQIELSGNTPGPQGGGVWLWIALNSNHTGDYAGSDCGHGGAGTASDKGDVTWQQVGDNIVISGVVLNATPTDPFSGNFTPWSTTITVPWNTGHYRAAGVGTYLTLPSWIQSDEGKTELQVAP